MYLYTRTALNHRLNKLQSYSLPSGSYVNLTLGKTGTEYIAPADGWFSISKRATAANQILALFLNSIGFGFKYASSDSQGCLTSCPVKKGDKIMCSYTAAGTTEFFRFIYAQGSAPQS